MRILIISSMAVPLPPLRYGGVEKVAYDLAVALSQRGHEVGLAAPEGSTIPKGIELLSCGHPGLADAEPRALSGYRGRLGEFEIVCDLSHLKLAHTYSPRVPNSAYVPVCGTTYLPQFETRTPRLVCVSQAHARFIKGRYGVEARVVYNGIDVDQYGPPIPMSEREERLIFIGRFAPEKGPLEALEFSKKLGTPIDIVEGRLNEPPTLSLFRYLAKTGFPGLGLVSGFYHGDVDLQYLRSIYGLMRTTNARYLSNVEQESKRELLRKAKAFIFPLQWEEPFGLTVAEASASGLPVVAYSRGSMPELILDGVTGFLIPPDDERLFAQRIGEVGSIDPMKCVAHARKNFSKEAMALGYERLFTEALGGKTW